MITPIEQIETWESEADHLADLPRDQLIALPIDSLDPSTRMANLCLNAGIETVGDLIEYSPAEIARFRSFVKRTIREMQTKLRVAGLSLRDDDGVPRLRRTEEGWL